MAKNYRMFIDDERFPPASWEGTDFVICRSLTEVQDVVELRGLPDLVSFDHDLGDNVPTGMDIAKWMVEQDLDKRHFFSQNFFYLIHSQNPVGAGNIKTYLNSYLLVREPVNIKKGH